MTTTRKILVTGANGVLGYAVARHFHRAGDTLLLTGIERDCPAAGEVDCNYEILDITDRAALNAIIDRFAPDVLINCAAFTSVDGCEMKTELSRRINHDAPAAMAQLCAGSSTIFVHYSSDYVFDGANGPYSEADPVNPINEYGRQKLAAERDIMSVTDNALIIRTNVLFGRAAVEQASFVSFVVNTLRAGKPANIVFDQYNNPTWSDDLAETTDVLLKAGARGIVNFSGTEYLSRLEFATLIAEVYGLPTELIHPISTESLSLPAPRPLMGGLKNDAVYRFSGIPRRKLKDILQTMKGATA